jgi:hypothetical protein
MTPQKPRKYSSHRYTGAIIAGSLLIGTAVGMLKHEVDVYSLFGLGAGLVFSSLISMVSARRNEKQ